MKQNDPEVSLDTENTKAVRAVHERLCVPDGYCSLCGEIDDRLRHAATYAAELACTDLREELAREAEERREYRVTLEAIVSLFRENALLEGHAPRWPEGFKRVMDKMYFLAEDSLRAYRWDA